MIIWITLAVMIMLFYYRLFKLSKKEKEIMVMLEKKEEKARLRNNVAKSNTGKDSFRQTTYLDNPKLTQPRKKDVYIEETSNILDTDTYSSVSHNSYHTNHDSYSNYSCSSSYSSDSSSSSSSSSSCD